MRKKKPVSHKEMITVDLPRLIAKQFDPVIRSVLGSMVVDILDQFSRQEQLYSIDSREFSGKMISMIESIKQEIATRFIGYHEDIMIRLKNVATLHLISQTAIAKVKEDKK